MRSKFQLMLLNAESNKRPFKSLSSATTALLLVAFCLSTSASEQEFKESFLRSYQVTREAENWTWLAQGASTEDLFDAIKFIPLSNGFSSLSFGGEMRVRAERIKNESWGVFGTGRNTYSLNRVRLHSSFQINSDLRIFGELQFANAVGRKGGPRPSIDENKADLQQLFADYKFNANWNVRVGRQELNYGNGRLISPRAGPINVRQPQDGFKFQYRKGRATTDFFAVKVVETDIASFSDSSSHGAEILGAYFASDNPYTSAKGFELYLLDHRRDSAVYWYTVGEEQRQSYGARTWRQVGRWRHDVEAVYQLGSLGSYDIGAWAFSTNSALLIGGRFNSSIEFSTGFNSGGVDVQKRDAKTFVAPLPRGGYFGQFAPMGPGNSQGLRISANLQPLPNLSVAAGIYGFWRNDSSDGLYGVSGFPLINGVSNEKRLGYQPELNIVWSLDRHLDIELNVAQFNPETFLEQIDLDNDINSLALSLRYRF